MYTIKTPKPVIDSPYVISDTLKKRHPYIEESKEHEKNTVYPSYGNGGMKRNINALKSDFEDLEKQKALRLLLRSVYGDEGRIRCIDFGIMDGLNVVLGKGTDMNFYASKICKELVFLPQGKKALYENGTFPLLFKVLRNPEGGRDRLAAAEVILQMVRSRLGVQLLLMVPGIGEDMTGVQTLVWMLDKDISKANDQVIFSCLEALIEIASAPDGREACAEAGLLLILAKIFEVDPSPFEEENALSMSIIRSACRLVFNACLDGEGQLQGKGILKHLIWLLHHAILIPEPSIIRYITAAVMLILVNEKAKPVLLEPIDGLESNSIDILCNLFTFLEQQEGALVENKESDTDSGENLKKNCKIALRHANELPAIRSFIKEKFGLNFFERISR